MLKVRIDPPDPSARLEILQLYCAGLHMSPTLTQELPLLATRIVGYVGADIAALCREAALSALERLCECVDWEHFEFALAKLGPPSSLRGIVPAGVGHARWDDIGGLNIAKAKMKQVLRYDAVGCVLADACPLILMYSGGGMAVEVPSCI